MAPPAFTEKWQRLRPQTGACPASALLELADPGQEAQAIAIALREVLRNREGRQRW
jgi:ATP-dependent helicase/nuclease subunit B